jgi:hypothetical protein
LSGRPASATSHWQNRLLLIDEEFCFLVAKYCRQYPALWCQWLLLGVANSKFNPEFFTVPAFTVGALAPGA